MDISKLYTTYPGDPDDSEGIRQYFLNIIDVMPNNVYWLNRDCITMGCNRNTLELIGLEKLEDFVGMTYEKMAKVANWTEGQAESFKRDDIEVMETGIPKYNIEEPPLYDENNNPLYYMSSRVPLFDKDGAVIGVVGISVDITKRKLMELHLKKAKEEAEQANRAKSEFIANMSHDVRTPITGIVGMTQDMLNTVEQAGATLSQQTQAQQDNTVLENIIATVRRDSHFLMGAADELLQLCNEILEVVRLESGGSAGSLESFSVPALIKHNIELLQPIAQHRKLKLTATIEPHVPQYIRGLRNYLDRSLSNLISNALKFTNEGHVDIEVKLLTAEKIKNQVGEAVTLQFLVKDTGIGIPEDKFEEIFEHFSRLSPSYEGLYKGAGLGLYTVKRYIEAMHGEIKVESKLGQGTCFTLALPFTIADHEERKRQSIRAPEKKPPVENVFPLKNKTEADHFNHTVLVVEDNQLAAMALNVLLENFECNIDYAQSGEEAINMVNAKYYDLILMDIGLPDKHGIEVAKKIRTIPDPKKSRIPIIAITGHADDTRLQQKILGAGIQEIVNKPAQSLVLEAVFKRYVFEAPKPPSKQNKKQNKDTMTNIIDWEASVHMFNGDADFTREMLSLLAVDIKKTEATLATHYANQDIEGLRAELHRTRGAVCYLKVPELDQALAALHEAAIHTDLQDNMSLKKEYVALQSAIHHFVKTWKESDF